MGFPYTFPITLVWRQGEAIELDALLRGQGSVAVGLDIILGIIPEKARRFALEIRDNGELLAILKDAYDIVYSLQENIPTLDFNLPADNGKTAYLARGREIWLRNMRTDTVIAKLRPSEQKERR